ncbi:hypothetical protein LCGC14_2560070 [marine sediment metagenome]|uniref:DNA helicase DnaB-like N-terminal domain-containing protein n=1 Tax=marine sediment metagenome TaxID=412755 RepID=A0A0F9DDE0_9ZZZZ
MNADSQLLGCIAQERNVLGAVMLSGSLREVVAGVMEDSDWVSPDHLTIWKVLRDGKSTHVEAVIANLDAIRALDHIGGEPYVASCIGTMACVYVRFPESFDDCLRWLHECGRRRRDEGAVMTRAAAEVQDIRAGSKPHWWDEYEEA